MKKIFLFGFLATVCISACKKDHDSNESHEAGLVTPVGTPDGTPISKSIDASGGSITSADGRLTINVPAGAFNAAQLITIQPITNTGPSGVNKAYRITPHNIQFAQPVKISFHYNDSDITGSTAEFLGISYQNEQGVWQAKRAAIVDTTTKTISTVTKHFSDWNIFRGLDISPEGTILNTGESVEIKVYVTGEDLFVSVPSTNDEDLIFPLPAPKEIPEKYVKTWSNSGAGSLAPNGNKAVYTAPATVPVRNPVAVSAELYIAGKRKLFLVCNVTVVSAETVLVKAEAGPGSGWHMLNGALQAVYDATSNQTSISAYEEGANAQNSKRLEITFKGNNAVDTLGWNWNAGIQLNYIVKVDGINTVYRSQWSDATTWHDSPGAVYITSYGKKGEYVTGTFSVGKSGYAKGGETTTSVSGSFKIKRL